MQHCVHVNVFIYTHLTNKWKGYSDAWDACILLLLCMTYTSLPIPAPQDFPKINK